MPVRALLRLIIASSFIAGLWAADSLITKPYLQLGDNRTGSAKTGLQLLWHSRDVETAWILEYRVTGAAKWQRVKPTFKRVQIPGIPAHRVYQAAITNLQPSTTFEYRLAAAGEAPFSAVAKSMPAPGKPARIVIFGDCGADTIGQRAVAYHAARQKPDMIHVTGDIVYSRGRITEYRSKFFPVYNHEELSEKHGAPLLRSVLFTAAPGNHDIQSSDLDQNNDGLAYFYYWAQPLNGPVALAGAPNANPLKGAADLTKAFSAAAGVQFPRMSTFSFDYGDSHWTILDSHGYTDWRDPALREWVRNDLKSAQKARWRFVSFHHPGFNSSKAHFADQQMRFLADLFEEGKVDIVFSGHVHNYQRSFPLTYRVNDPGNEKKVNRLVGGQWTLDRTYDGKTQTRPKGVIYIVTGAGGAGLYNPEQQLDKSSWQEFTTQFTADRHSFTLMDLDGGKATLQQIGADGGEIDSFVIEK